MSAKLARAVGMYRMPRSLHQEIRDRLRLAHRLMRRRFSQNGEDRILESIFDVIGTTNKWAVEIACGNGWECNTANLLIRHGWSGLLIDGEERNVAEARHLFRISGASDRARTYHEWVRTDNVNRLLSPIAGEIDLLSIDVDGNDYWLWQALEVVQPRVVVIEYNASLGPKACVTIPYEPHFRRHDHDPRGWYHGASIWALDKLGCEKGYWFAGCEDSGVNAFFIRKDQPFTGQWPAFHPHRRRLEIASQAEQMEHLVKFPWESV